MNHNIRAAAATAALVTGLLAAAGTAQAAQRIDAQQLSAHLDKAVAAEQANGETTGGPILGAVTSSPDTVDS
ncbi:hypothetical protein A8W25_29625 [Streptomyces sp. ERV7]|uniref:hypothetical protein n=1 Tax=Streptomyces sp. ERV7 TaxID=1322334 RepID=UPI0007F53A08|nr:hypothetical protein [Streptomyces sp. ERV7]OAR22130.1 hypothetical protein A8W25_29625 [Streptomyces sp. ERV7]